MKAADYYDTVAEEYFEHYQPNIEDVTKPYPANWFRLQLLKREFADRKNIIDVGCGDGSATRQVSARKCGFDVSEKMVEIARNKFPAIVADITKPETYRPLLKHGPFDGLIAMGVMPHIEDEDAAIANMAELVKGKVFVEFRNKLFSLFTFNRLTIDLIKEMETLPGADDILRSRLLTFEPRQRPYDEMLARFHNPLEVPALFEKHGFHDIKLLWYHYHPTLPIIEKRNPAVYRKAAAEMEGTESWKSMFMCSAFVVVANNE